VHLDGVADLELRQVFADLLLFDGANDVHDSDASFSRLLSCAS
jgi:hypothetical protein